MEHETSRFLPISPQDMRARDWYYYDFLLITGDAYIDHPSFGAAVIGRVLESAGYRVCILAQPRDVEEVKTFPAPRYAVLVTAGNLDSMVAHYTAAKKPRRNDAYTPGGVAGRRPDRATIVYTGYAKAAFAGVPVILGGLEASLRRFAHYDYWQNKVRRSVLFDSKADLLIYGMGETAILEIAAALKAKKPISEITSIRGTAYIAKTAEQNAFETVQCPSFEAVSTDKKAYAIATKLQNDTHDPIRGQAVVQAHGERFLIVNPPQMPLEGAALDKVYALPYAREVHPMYEAEGGVPAIQEVQFSVIHNRGCFGACNFCALAFHQGKMVTARSHASVLAEAEQITKHPEFKGYIHDVGGPTANFRGAACKKQAKSGTCCDKNCLSPKPCPALEVNHTDYLKLLRKIRAIPGIKRVFVRSGIRYDYLVADKNSEFFAELVHYHVSGQLKVAPEHMVDEVLTAMGKPKFAVYEAFAEKFQRLNQKYGKEQYLVPYLMSSHPGSRLEDAVKLAETLHKMGKYPEQVQDFYPTPGTISTCMYYTGINPLTMQEIYVATSERERNMQRALLQWRNPEKRRLVLEALKTAGREDLIGFSKHCLVRPENPVRKRKNIHKKP